MNCSIFYFLGQKALRPSALFFKACVLNVKDDKSVDNGSLNGKSVPSVRVSESDPGFFLVESVSVSDVVRTHNVESHVCQVDRQFCFSI